MKSDEERLTTGRLKFSLIKYVLVLTQPGKKPGWVGKALARITVVAATEIGPAYKADAGVGSEPFVVYRISAVGSMHAKAMD